VLEDTRSEDELPAKQALLAIAGACDGQKRDYHTKEYVRIAITDENIASSS